MNSYATNPWPNKGLNVHEEESQYDREAVKSNGAVFYNRTQSSAGKINSFLPHECDIQGPGSQYRSSRHEGLQAALKSNHNPQLENGHIESYHHHQGKQGDIVHQERPVQHSTDYHHCNMSKNGKEERISYASGEHGSNYQFNHFVDERRFHESSQILRSRGGTAEAYASSPLSSWSPTSDGVCHRPHQVTLSPRDPRTSFQHDKSSYDNSARYHTNVNPPIRDPRTAPSRKSALLMHPPPPVPSGHAHNEEQRRFSNCHREDATSQSLPSQVVTEKIMTSKDPRLVRNKTNSHLTGRHHQLHISQQQQQQDERVSTVERIKMEHSYCGSSQHNSLPRRSAPERNNIIKQQTEARNDPRYHPAGLPRHFLSLAPKVKAKSSLVTSSLPASAIKENSSKRNTRNTSIVKISPQNAYIQEFKFPTAHATVPVNLGGFELDLDTEPESSCDEWYMSDDDEKEMQTEIGSSKVDNTDVADQPRQEPLSSVATTNTNTQSIQYTSKFSEPSKLVLTKLHVPTCAVVKRHNQLPDLTVPEEAGQLETVQSLSDTDSIVSNVETTCPLTTPAAATDKTEDGFQPTRRSKRLAQRQEVTSESDEEIDHEDGRRTLSMFGSSEDEEYSLDEVMSLRRKNSESHERRKRHLRSKRLQKSKRSKLEHSKDKPSGLHIRQKTQFNDFVPEILPARSRTESATLLRRNEMEKELELHERERLQTARPEDILERAASPLDTMAGDDLSSEQSTSHFTLSSYERDSVSTKSTLAEDFSPEIIAQCKKMSTRNFSGDTALHKVCRSGKYELVRYMLLVENTPANVQDNAGWAPLHEACSSLHIDIVKLLLQNGADVNISATDGTRPIHDAIERGSLELVKLLVKHGADPQAEFGEKTPVEYAKLHDQMEIHDYLESVIVERQKLLKSRKPAPSVPTIQKRTLSLRGNKKQKMLKETIGELMRFPTIPVCGYKPDDPKMMPELDFPLFYVTPIVELSETPFLPTYNIEIVSGDNPRRHNFYLLSDLLRMLEMKEQDLLYHLPDVSVHELTVSDFHNNLRDPHYNRHVNIPNTGKGNPKTKKIKLVPLCKQLQSLMDISVENLDD